MAQGPCLNPNCSSHGAPHPNCRCYGEMAEGGSVQHYCDTNQPHNPDCEYYAEGGDVQVPDELQALESPEQPEQTEIPPELQSLESPTQAVPQQPQTDNSQYSTPEQQVLTGIEGAAQGVAGPLATAAERGLSALGVPGLTPEDIAGRQAANPKTHAISEAGAFAASLFAGVGEAKLLSTLGAKAATKLISEAAGVASKVGQAVIKGGIETGLFQAGDEVSKAMLGQGDPNTPVASALAHIAGAGLVGSATGGVFGLTGSAASKGLQAIENLKLGTKAQNIVAGLGAAKEFNGDEAKILKSLKLVGKEDLFKQMKPGIDFYNKGIKTLSDKATDLAAETIGVKEGGLPGYVAAKTIEKLVEPFTGKVSQAVMRKMTPTIVRILSSGNANGIYETLDYASKVNKGAQAINKSIDSLFKSGGTQASDYLVDSYTMDKRNKKLNEYIENGGLDQQLENENVPEELQDAQNYAEGGVVNQPKQPQIQKTEGGISAHFPEQSALLMAAKGRIYNYLNSMKPAKIPSKLPFDRKPDDTQKQRSYDKALDIANQPLGIIERIKKGTITAEHMQHMANMYPDLHTHLSQKITNKITEHQMDEHQLPYRVRQGLSLFLGAHLDSTMTPQSIQAAQATFMPQQPQQGTQPKGKPSAMKTKDTKDYRTPNQAAESDRVDR